jgi:hypothetical protein
VSDLSAFLVTGTNNPEKQVSKNFWNNFVAALEGEIAATRTAIGALAPAAGDAVMLVESGREGQFVFDASDLSTEVAADAAQGIYIAPDSDTTGNSGAWVRRFFGMVSPLWFGMVAGSSGAAVANSAARDAMFDTLAARAYVYTGLFQALEPIQFDHRKYWFNDPWNFAQGMVNIFGTSTGIAGSFGTTWKFPAGSDGVLLQYYNTSGDSGGDTGAHPNVAGTRISGVRIEGAFDEVFAEGEHHGFVIRTPVVLENCTAFNFQGDGFRMHASAGGGGMLGNANLTELRMCSAQNNRNGISFAGADVGVYRIYGGTFDNNRQFGHYEPDDASLGGTVIGAHYDSNGVTGYEETVGPCVTSYGGHYYSVLWGEEAWVETNAPSGTTADNQGWYWIGTGPPVETWPEWVSGITTWRAGGPVLVKSVNAGTCFINCYSEPGVQPRPQADIPALFDGGSLADHPNMGTGGVRVFRNTDGFKFNYHLSVNKSGCRFGPRTGAATPNVMEFASTYGTSEVQWSTYTTAGAISSTDAYTGSITDYGYQIAGAAKIDFKIGASPSSASPTIAEVDANGVNLASGKVLKVNGTQVVSAQGAAVADAAALTSVDGTNAVAAPTQAEFNALVAEFNKLRVDVAAIRTPLNTSLARQRAHGLIAT